MSASLVLLVIGYAVATPLALICVRIAWRGWHRTFAALEAATVAVAVGWFLRGRPTAGWGNAGFAVGFAIMWVVVRRVRATREAPR